MLGKLCEMITQHRRGEALEIGVERRRHAFAGVLQQLRRHVRRIAPARRHAVRAGEGDHRRGADFLADDGSRGQRGNDTGALCNRHRRRGGIAQERDQDRRFTRIDACG